MKDKDTYMLMEAYNVSQTKGAIISEGKVAEWIKSKILSKLDGFKEWLNGPGQQALKQHGILKEDFVFQESMGDWLKILGPTGIIGALAVYLNMNPEVVQQVVDFFPDLMDQITSTLSGGEVAGGEAVPEPPVEPEVKAPNNMTSDGYYSPVGWGDAHQGYDVQKDMDQAWNKLDADGDGKLSNTEFPNLKTFGNAMRGPK